MADVEAIRARLKTLIEAIDGLRAYDKMDGSVVPPCAIITPAPGDFVTRAAFDAEDVRLVVTVLVKQVAVDTAEDNLNEYLSDGTSQVADAIDVGKTADWDFSMPETARNYGTFTFGADEAAVQYLGFEIPVHVGV